MNKRITIISCVSLGCAVVIATAGLTTKNNNSDLIQVGQIDASIEPSIEQSIEPSMEPLSNEDVMDEQVETLHTSTPETITPSSNPEDAVNKSSAKPQETTKPQVTSKPKTVNNTYKSTMYDYSKAGVKSATGRVVPEDYISVTEFGVTPNSGNDVSGKVEKAIYSATQKGKYLYFPEGTYYMKNVKIYDADNVKICGAGEKTIIKTANDATGDVWDIVLGIYNSNGPIVRNLVFDGNNKVVPGNLTVGVIQLRLENCDNAKVYGCRFQNNNSGNLNIVDEAKNLEVFYCDFLNSDCSIITSPGYITKGYLCNNFIDGQDWKYSEPISLYYAEDRGTNTDVIISGNDIRNHDNGAGAIFITYPSTNISILNNYIYKIHIQFKYFIN